MKHDVVSQMSSLWPARLRAMAVNDTLLIKSEELNVRQASSLVGNMNYRLKGAAVYKVIHDERGDSLVTCVHKKRGYDLTARKGRQAAFIHMDEPESATAATPTLPTTSKAKTMLGTIPAVAIVECRLLNNHTQTHRPSSDEELNALLRRCQDNMQVTEIEVYRPAQKFSKQVQWAAANL